MPTSICPECSEEVFVDADSEQGDTIHCDECGANLVVVGLDPIELDLQDESEVDSSADHDAFGNYDYDDERF
jgi:alpha-aminoadipate carrier protein LysW